MERRAAEHMQHFEHRALFAAFSERPCSGEHKVVGLCLCRRHLDRVFARRLLRQAGKDLILHAAQHKRRQVRLALDQALLKIAQALKVTGRGGSAA